jgi:uncharacterized membrane protein
MTKTRLEAFSDGVIAIIITIMVLEMKVPHDASWEAVLKLKWVFASYAISFLSLGIYWGNHHHLIHTIKHFSGGVMWANLHLLFWLSLVPFVTGWMGENNFSQNTIILYSVVATLCGVAYYILLLVIRKCNPHNEELNEVLRKQSRKGTISIIIYLLAIAGVFVHPAIAGVLVVLVSVMWLIPDKNIERTTKHQQ